MRLFLVCRCWPVIRFIVRSCGPPHRVCFLRGLFMLMIFLSFCSRLGSLCVIVRMLLIFFAFSCCECSAVSDGIIRFCVVG